MRVILGRKTSPTRPCVSTSRKKILCVPFQQLNSLLLFKVQPGCCVYIKFYPMPYLTVGSFISFGNAFPLFLIAFTVFNEDESNNLKKVQSALRMKKGSSYLFWFPSVMFSEMSCCLKCRCVFFNIDR